MNVIKFKTDNVFITIQDNNDDLKRETEKECPYISIFFAIEDFSGNLYERQITIESLEAMSPIFRMDPLLFKELINLKPKTLLAKDSVICKYEIDIFGRKQIIDVNIPSKIYPHDSNIETLELKKQLQNLKTELKMVKMVVEKLFTEAFINHIYGDTHIMENSFERKFDKSITEAMDFLKMSCVLNNGSTFYHQAFIRGMFIEEISPSFIDINSTDLDGNTVLHKIDNKYDLFLPNTNRYDLICKLVNVGADCNLLNNNKHTCLWKLCAPHCVKYLDREYLHREKYLKLLKLILEKGGNPNLGTYSVTDGRSLLTIVRGGGDGRDFSKWSEVAELLIKYGAK